MLAKIPSFVAWPLSTVRSTGLAVLPSRTTGVSEVRWRPGLEKRTEVCATGSNLLAEMSYSLSGSRITALPSASVATLYCRPVPMSKAETVVPSPTGLPSSPRTVNDRPWVSGSA